MTDVRANQQMRDLGVVQHGALVLAEPARPFDLPAERGAADQTVEMLFASIERIARVHTFAKGMGIAASQIGIGRAAAVVQPPEEGAGAIVLFNPASPPPPTRATSSTRDACRSSTSAASFPVPCGSPSRPPRWTAPQ